MKRPPGWTFLLLVLMLISASCAHDSSVQPVTKKSPPLTKTKINVGSKSMTEQYLLMKMTSLILREHGYPVRSNGTFARSRIWSATLSSIIRP